MILLHLDIKYKKIFVIFLKLIFYYNVIVVFYNTESQKNIWKPKVSFEKLTEYAFRPAKGSGGAAGYDLFSAYSYIVPAKSYKLIETDISIKMPPGIYGRIAGRSGLALHDLLDITGGVIGRL